MSRLKELRENAGLSQSELSRKLRLSRSTLSYVEAGKRNISTELAVKIADFFNVSIEYLLGKDDVDFIAAIGTLLDSYFDAMAKASITDYLKNEKDIIIYTICRKAVESTIEELRAVREKMQEVSRNG